MDKQIIRIASFLTLFFTYVHVAHVENSVIYGFPFGYLILYPKASTFTSSFYINMFLLLVNFIITYLTILVVKKTWNKLILNRKKWAIFLLSNQEPQ